MPINEGTGDYYRDPNKIDECFTCGVAIFSDDDFVAYDGLMFCSEQCVKEHTRENMKRK